MKGTVKANGELKLSLFAEQRIWCIEYHGAIPLTAYTRYVLL